eukprot:TRINITY_DN78990_c0_g1_i1.p2 TRINITY_DN78990_c0_g1~~TRINITY_DN78990_c0_g1_i1.p2  ORF type:complete len:107 (-),score=13.96 TRINITY_DN78990_c0_g1_i1:19-339(-)
MAAAATGSARDTAQHAHVARIAALRERRDLLDQEVVQLKAETVILGHEITEKTQRSTNMERSLIRKRTAKEELDAIIWEMEAAYTKIHHSSQRLAQVLQSSYGSSG